MAGTLCFAEPSARSRPDGLPVGARGAVSGLFLMNGLLFASWASRVPAIQTGQGLGHGALGLALLVMAGGAFLAMPSAGFLIARVGSRNLCRVSVLAYCAALPLLALAPGWLFFLPALFFFGAAHGTLDIAMNAQAVGVEKGYARPIMASFHALWSAGGMAGAVLGGVLAAHRCPPAMHFTLVAVVLAAGAVALFPYLRDYRREEKRPSPTGKKSLRAPGRPLLLLGVMALCVMMGEGAMADWSALYLKEILGTGESLASAGYAVFSLAMVAGRLSGDRLVERFRPDRMVGLAGWTAAAGLLAALFAPNAAVALAGFACTGAGFSLVVPTVFSAAGTTPGISRGAALSIVSTVGYLGFLLGPPVIGLVAEGLQLRGALGLIVGASILVACLAPVLRPRRFPG